MKICPFVCSLALCLALALLAGLWPQPAEAQSEVSGSMKLDERSAKRFWSIQTLRLYQRELAMDASIRSRMLEQIQPAK